MRLRGRGGLRGDLDQESRSSPIWRSTSLGHCVLATNTSSLSVAEMAADLVHPERVVGFHFFNPVAVMPLVEVVRAPSNGRRHGRHRTRPGQDTKKNAVLVEDATGFVVNRICCGCWCEIFVGGRRGHPDPGRRRGVAAAGPADAAVRAAATRRSAVALHVGESLHASFGDRFSVSAGLRAIVAANRPGVYDWGADGKPYVSEETQKLIDSGDRPSTADQVRSRTLRRAGRGDRPDAGRGGGRVADGHRPVHDPGRRLALPPGRDHPVPGSRRDIRAGARPTVPAPGGSVSGP